VYVASPLLRAHKHSHSHTRAYPRFPRPPSPPSNDTYTVPLKVPLAESARASLARAIYSQLFTWLVERINNSVSWQGPESGVKNTIAM
jgi:myosin heavy subunit